MNNQPYLFRKQIFSLIVAIFFLFATQLAGIVKWEQSMLLESYVLIISLTTFLPSIKREFGYSSSLQRIFLTLPMFFIFSAKVWQIQHYNTANDFLVILGVLFAIFLFVLERKKTREMMHGLKSKIKINHREFLFELSLLFISIIGEELWFRSYFFNVYKNDFDLMTIIISSVLFVHCHFMGRWSNHKYNKLAYFRLFIFSCFVGTVYFFTNSIVGVVSIHIIYDLPLVLLLYTQYKAEAKESYFDDY
jgi:membrane protease YdiL (CAAX protease family)